MYDIQPKDYEVLWWGLYHFLGEAHDMADVMCDDMSDEETAVLKATIYGTMAKMRDMVDETVENGGCYYDV